MKVGHAIKSTFFTHYVYNNTGTLSPLLQEIVIHVGLFLLLLQIEAHYSSGHDWFVDIAEVILSLEKTRQVVITQ